MQYSFLTELIKRFASQSPKFFKIMQIIGLIGLVLSGAVKAGIEYQLFTPPNGPQISHAMTAAIAFFGGWLIPAGATTTEAKLQDEKTVINVLKDKTLR